MKPKILLLANASKENYANAVEFCGATAICKYLPDLNVEYDGLIICGGNDIHPSYYNQKINGAIDFDIERDRTEFQLVNEFLKTNKPIMAICRGHQLLNVALGGTLIQDINCVKKHRSGDINFPAQHYITAKQNSILSNIYGDRFIVNSIHHQAIDKLGEGLIATGFSDEGIIEAVEHKTKPYFAVQFHPERMCLNLRKPNEENGIKLFEYFINLCKK